MLHHPLLQRVLKNYLLELQDFLDLLKHSILGEVEDSIMKVVEVVWVNFEWK